MAWANATVTKQGISLLQQSLEGVGLQIDYAAGGTGFVAPESLSAQTALLAQKQQLPIVSITDSDRGKIIGAQITNINLDAGYQMTQYGIWAHNESNPPVLVAIMQDPVGLNIPSKTEIAEFVFTFYSVLAFSEEAEWSFVMDPSVLVTYSLLVAEANVRKNADMALDKRIDGAETELGNHEISDFAHVTLFNNKLDADDIATDSKKLGGEPPEFYVQTAHFAEFEKTVDSQLRGIANKFASAQIILDVNKSGSDTTGDGTPAKPFLTIQKAIDKTYEYVAVKAFTYLVRVGAGTYNENVTVYPASQSRVWLYGATRSDTIIAGVSAGGATISTTGRLIISGITLKNGPAGSRPASCLSITAVGDVFFYQCALESHAQGLGYGIWASSGAHLAVGDDTANSVLFNGFYIAIYAYGHTFCQAYNLGGAGNNIAYYSRGSSIIVRGGTNPGATTLESKSVGGQIFS